MGDYSSLYKYEKFEIIGDELVPLGIFSVDGNGTMPLVFKEECDRECGCPEPIYQWIQTEDTVCIEVITYKLQATYSDSSTLNVECGSASDSLLKSDTQPTGYTASAMTDAIIGDCVTSIGNNGASNAPFNGCRSLTAVTIPNSVTTIGSWAFGNCINLSNITIPDSVTIIDYGGFNNCERLTAVTFGSGVTTIGESTFSYCRSLSSITIPNSVTTIGNWAFQDCSGLTSIELPNSVASLSRGIFNSCTSLPSVTIPNTVLSIGDDAFYGCSSLTSVTIPDSVTTIGDRAFQSCYNLVSVNIPDGVTQIHSQTFYGCSSLTSVTIPSRVFTIDTNAFRNCTSLTSVTIPSGVTHIGNGAFGNCSGLTSITCLATTPPTLDSTNAFSGTNDCPIYVPCESVSAYQAATNWSNYASRIEGIPPCGQPTPASPKFILTLNDTSTVSAECDSTSSITQAEISAYTSTTVSAEIGECVTSIDDFAFYEYTSLTSCTLGDSVTSIGLYAFERCSGLTSIDIPDSITSIDTFAFSTCTNLTSIDIPDSVTNIGGDVFLYCPSLTSVTIGSGVTSIGWDAFKDCTSLASVTVNATTPPTLGTNAFDNTNNCPIYVPCASVDTYKAASGWSNYASRIQGIPPCSQPTPASPKFTLTLNDSSVVSAECDSTSAITSAETSDYSLDIISATIGDCVTTIGDEAFNNCMSLTSVTIPNSVTTIGDYAFYDCDLHEINLPNTLINLGDGAFKYCQYLQDVDIPVGYVPNECFSHCPNLQDVDLSLNTTTIDFGAFSSCYSLESIDIPSAIETINYEAFKDCENLASVYVHATTPPTLRNDSFDGTPIADGTGTIYVPSGSVNAYKAASGWSTYASQIQAIP